MMVVDEHCCIISDLDDFYFLSANDNAFDVIVAFQGPCEMLNYKLQIEGPIRGILT